MKNSIFNQRPRRACEQYTPYAVIDTRTGAEIFQGTSEQCSEYAMDVESGRIPSYLTIICIG